MPTPNPSPGAFVPALEGLRGVAVVLVVVSHVLPRSDFGAALGGIGVTTFFTLSGFLITGVLQRGPLRSVRALRQFYAARFARLLPALLLLVATVSVVWLLQGRAPAQMAEYALTSTLYVENFFAVAHDQQVLVHTWSLAVEEQFYLVWPFALLLAARLPRRLLRAVLLGIMLLSVGLKVALDLHGHGTAAYTSLPTNAYALLLGAMVRLNPVSAINFNAVGARLGWLGLALVIGTAWLLPHSVAVAPVLAAVCSVPIILGSLDGSRALELRPVRFLGRTSYAWYLWHWPLLWLTATLHQPILGTTVALLALLVASASTLLVEEPLRRHYRMIVKSRSQVPAYDRHPHASPVLSSS